MEDKSKEIKNMIIDWDAIAHLVSKIVSHYKKSRMLLPIRDLFRTCCIYIRIYWLYSLLDLKQISQSKFNLVPIKCSSYHINSQPWSYSCTCYNLVQYPSETFYFVWIFYTFINPCSWSSHKMRYSKEMLRLAVSLISLTSNTSTSYGILTSQRFVNNDYFELNTLKFILWHCINNFFQCSATGFLSFC